MTNTFQKPQRPDRIGAQVRSPEETASLKAASVAKFERKQAAIALKKSGVSAPVSAPEPVADPAPAPKAKKSKKKPD